MPMKVVFSPGRRLTVCPSVNGSVAPSIKVRCGVGHQCRDDSMSGVYRGRDKLQRKSD